MNYWVLIYRFAWGLLIVLFAVGLACVFVPQCNKLREMQREKAALEARQRALETEIRDLRTRQNRFENELPYVERTARESHGMVKTNETIFKFPQE